MNRDFVGIILEYTRDSEDAKVKVLRDDVLRGSYLGREVYNVFESTCDVDESVVNKDSLKLVKEKYGKGVSLMWGDREYRYISDEMSSEELYKKLVGIFKHQGVAQIRKWLDSHAIVYWDSVKGARNFKVQENSKCSTEPANEVTQETALATKVDTCLMPVVGEWYSFDDGEYQVDFIDEEKGLVYVKDSYDEMYSLTLEEFKETVLENCEEMSDEEYTQMIEDIEDYIVESFKGKVVETDNSEIETTGIITVVVAEEGAAYVIELSVGEDYILVFSEDDDYEDEVKVADYKKLVDKLKKHLEA